MKIEINGEATQPSCKVLPITIRLDKVEVEEQKGIAGTLDVLQIFVENEEGLTGRFCVRMVIESGRPKIIVDAYKKSKTHKVTTVNATADWNL